MKNHIIRINHVIGAMLLLASVLSACSNQTDTNDVVTTQPTESETCIQQTPTPQEEFFADCSDG